MKELITINGYKAIVDDSDYERLVKYRWYYLNTSKHKKYLMANRVVEGHKFLHRFVLNAPEGKVVDHIDGNTLDNRKCNLQICNQNTNMQKANAYRPRKNRHGIRSEYKGVSWNDERNKWSAGIMVNGKWKSLGYFMNEIDAARKRDITAKHLYGEHAFINLP
jgi:hypothetical protein